MQNSNQKDRLVFREKVARDLGVILNPPLTFRAAKFAAQFKSRDEVVRWLNRPNTLNTWQMGRKTYNELCQAFGLAIPTHGPRTLGARLRAAEARIVELEKRIEVMTYTLERIRDIDWLQYSNRIDAIQQFAKEALK